MNKRRREQVKTVYTQLKDIKFDIESILRDEQDSYDAIPENLQETERAYESEEAIDKLEDAVNSVEDAIDSLYEVV